MRRRLDLLPEPPPRPLPAVVGGGIAETIGGGGGGGGGGATSSSSSKGNLTPSLLIIGFILIAVLLFSIILHLLLRYLNGYCCSSSSSPEDHDMASDHAHHSHRISSRRVSPEYQSLIDSLPLFSFDSVTGLKTSSAVDCAVCLSKFEPHDSLRLLPLCCHAFHAHCIDTWLASSHTCPLCRSTIHVDESDEMAKLSSSSAAGNSFRLEIGSFSRQRVAADSSGLPSTRRSYSMGSFEYVVEENSEVVVEPMHRRGVSDYNLGRKEKDGEDSPAPNVPDPQPQGAQVAADVAGGGRSWLKDYVDRLASSASSSFSSRTLSFRFSGRTFTGSSRRSDGAAAAAVTGAGETGNWDLEGNWISEEMGSFFRWLSGI
ncbi:E3 ubiquitin-protein ligase ATL4-like [Macadamia integrifolia]|uniref:E3 ubiquitin-protein ligase ATL4-like n=1 Tax=Macadamia integrifolia TaxID=60698 RepID=UPI001C4FDB39|nr:E3 ubiquitin-protein ligase ATL4-like [Macadamia integrifolia]